MAFNFTLPNETEIGEFTKALKKHDKFRVNNWMSERTGGRMSDLNNDLFESWCFLAQMYTFPDMEAELVRVTRALK